MLADLAPDAFTAAYDGRLVAEPVESGNAVRVSRRGGGQLLHIEPHDGWTLGNLFLAGRYVVAWEDPQVRSADGPDARVTRYDVRDGSALVLTELGSIPTPGVPPTWSIDRGHLAYPVQRGQRNCVAVVATASLDTVRVHCAPRGRYAGWPSVSAGQLIYSQYTGGQDTCRRLVQVALHDGSATELPAQQECAPFSGVAGKGFVVWSESPPDTQQRGTAEMYGLAGDEVVALGEGRTSSEVQCRGWAYWVTEFDESAEVRRWRPGADVEIAYSSPEGYVNVSAPRCDRELLTVQQSWAGGGHDHQQIVASDLS